MIMNSNRLLHNLLGFILLTTGFTHALNDHFYRASWTPTEPRFERNRLQSFNFLTRTGTTHSAYNQCGHKTSLFDLYGTHNLAQAANGVSCLNPNNPTDALFLSLAQEGSVSPDKNFGVLSIDGRMHVTEFALSLEQNTYHGIFWSLFLPISIQNIKDVSWHDLTNPEDTTATWETIKAGLPELLIHRYNLHLTPAHMTSYGCDGYALLGWTNNNDATEVFDYVDTTLQAGIAFPYEKKLCETWYPLDLYSASHGHWGMPVRAAISGGLFEWLTLGGSVDATFYAPKNRRLRLKTAPEQRGLVILDVGNTKVHQGPLMNASTYLKIDHLADALSFLFGYSYAKKAHDSLCPCCKTFQSSIVNKDPRFKGWDMHTLHFASEYDFSREDKRFGPRVGLFYDKIVAGESIINTSMGGGLFGLEIALDLP